MSDKTSPQFEKYWRETIYKEILQLSPMCREPLVFSDRPNCNCWLGIQHAAVVAGGAYVSSEQG
jgi:hypothetical protein